VRRRQTEDLVGFERRSIVQQAIGGANTQRQREAIRRNRPMIVVGTPGRVAELSREVRTHSTRCSNQLDRVDSHGRWKAPNATRWCHRDGYAIYPWEGITPRFLVNSIKP
jgi:hypothetical protein